MNPLQVTGLGTAVLLIAVAQGSLVARLPWPGSGTPHLAALFVVATALAAGPRVGAVTGFATGLLLDLLPPASHALGQWAFVLCLLGLLLGLLLSRLMAETAGSLLLTVTVAGVGAALAPLLFTLLGQLLGDPRADVLGAVTRLPAGALWTLLCALLITLLNTVLPPPRRWRRRRAGGLPIEPVAPRIPLAVR